MNHTLTRRTIAPQERGGFRHHDATRFAPSVGRVTITRREKPEAARLLHRTAASMYPEFHGLGVFHHAVGPNVTLKAAGRAIVRVFKS